MLYVLIVIAVGMLLASFSRPDWVVRKNDPEVKRQQGLLAIRFLSVLILLLVASRIARHPTKDADERGSRNAFDEKMLAIAQRKAETMDTGERFDGQAALGQLVEATASMPEPQREIGRASCRERV